MSIEYSAEQFIKGLETYRAAAQGQTDQGSESTSDDQFLVVTMGQIFALAKQFIDMPLVDIEKLLISPVHRVKVGALSIMDKQARHKKMTASRRRELYDLYMRHHDHIDTWDLVDLAAPYVVGGYLFDQPRNVLYELAQSATTWERRTAIVATLYFVRQGDVEDTFKIAEMLLRDKQDLIHKATGWALREAGKKHRDKLISFLEKYAATMPRVALRYAIEHFDDEQRKRYMGMKKLTK